MTSGTMKLEDMDDKKIGKHGPSPGKHSGQPDVAPWAANMPG